MVKHSNALINRIKVRAYYSSLNAPGFGDAVWHWLRAEQTELRLLKAKRQAAARKGAATKAAKATPVAAVRIGAYGSPASRF